MRRRAVPFLVSPVSAKVCDSATMANRVTVFDEKAGPTRAVLRRDGRPFAPHADVTAAAARMPQSYVWRPSAGSGSV